MSFDARRPAAHAAERWKCEVAGLPIAVDKLPAADGKVVRGEFSRAAAAGAAMTSPKNRR